MIRSQSYTIKFIKKENLAKNTYTFYFERPDDFDFLAGQYNRWTLPKKASDGRGSSRFFTISSSPSEKKFLTITTKILQSDFKKGLVQLQENQDIKIFGPMGQFVFDETQPHETVFIAGGIGITPFYSKLTEAAAKKNDKQVTLIASFSTQEDAIFLDDLYEIAKRKSNITIVYTITKPQESPTSWRGENGRISETMIKKYVKDITASIFYIVGPPPMVEAVQKLLIGMNILTEHIKTEQFTGY